MGCCTQPYTRTDVRSSILKAVLYMAFGGLLHPRKLTNASVRKFAWLKRTHDQVYR